MASFYQTFTSARTSRPDYNTLLAQLRALDPSAGLGLDLGPTYHVKKATAWTQPQINAAQTVINTAPETTPQLTAQAQVDALQLYEKAFILALIDQINVLRAALPVPLAAITPAQALAAIRAKAGTL